MINALKARLSSKRTDLLDEGPSVQTPANIAKGLGYLPPALGAPSFRVAEKGTLATESMHVHSEDSSTQYLARGVCPRPESAASTGPAISHGLPPVAPVGRAQRRPPAQPLAATMALERLGSGSAASASSAPDRAVSSSLDLSGRGPRRAVSQGPDARTPTGLRLASAGASARADSDLGTPIGRSANRGDETTVSARADVPLLGRDSNNDTSQRPPLPDSNTGNSGADSHSGCLQPRLQPSRPSSSGKRSMQSARSASQFSPRAPSTLEAAVAEAQLKAFEAVESCGKMEKVVTVGGVPVAAEGDLVYLGGGLWGAAVPPPPKEAEKPCRQRRKVLPGRINAPPRPLGARSAVRSASAHLVGPQTCESPAPSRAHSDGQLGMDEAKDAGPRAWRPAGASKLPKAPEAPPRPHRAVDPNDCGPPGGNSEIRAKERSERARELVEKGMFGPKGVLQQLREHELRDAQVAPIDRATGPPQNSDLRAQERKAAKELKMEILLRQRAERLAAQGSKSSRLLHRSSAGSSSAPDLSARNPDDIEKQKLRVACKMEIVDFFNGYSSSLDKMTAEQTKILLSKLHTGSNDAELAEIVQQCDDERQQLLNESEAKVDDQQSIHRRLQKVNDLCNKAFEGF